MTSVKRSINLNDFGKDTGKRRRTLTEDELEKFAFGSIIKVKVKNFVTYASTEFNLSPSLNMIIGPNGTGKSTFVCAVCLGLAGHPTLLGRQKVLSGFIKNGEQSATIEITLKNKSGLPNLVITRFLYQNNKSEWHVNSKPSSELKVKDLLLSFNIQLDNLCQFLPQEKVADFAKLSQENLLLETQRAIDVNLLDQHRKLIDLDKIKLEVSDVLDAKVKEYEQLTQSKERYIEEARKYEEYQKKKLELEDHEKLLPYAQLQDLKYKADELKAERDSISNELKELNNKSQPYERAVSEFELKGETFRNKIHDNKQKQKKLLDNLTAFKAKLSKLDGRQELLKSTIENFKTMEQDTRHSLQMYEAGLVELETKRDTLEIVDENEIIQIRQTVDRLHDEKLDIQTQISSKSDELRQKKHEIDRASIEITKTQDEFKSTDKIHLLPDEKPQRDTKNAVSLLRTKYKQFRNVIFEPPLLTITATNQKYGSYLEDLLDFQTKLALTAKSRDDYNKVTKILIDEEHINAPFRYISNADLSPNKTTEELQQLGFDGYLRDFVKGPDEVVQMLCEQAFIHDIPVAAKPLSDAQIEYLRRPHNGDLMFRKFFSGDTLYSMNISKYGSRQITLSTRHVKRGRDAFSSGGLTDDRKKQLQDRIVARQNKITKLKESAAPLRESIREFHTKEEEIQAHYDETHAELRRLNVLKKEYIKLDQKIQTLNEKISQVKDNLRKDHSHEIQKNRRRLQAVILEKMTQLSNIASAQSQYNSIARDITLNRIDLFEQENKKVSVTNLTQSLADEKKRLQNALIEAKRKIQDLKNNPIRRELAAKTSSYSEEVRERLASLITKYTEQGTFSETAIFDIIESLSSELKLLGNSSKSSVHTLEAIVEKIKTLDKEIQDLSEKLGETTQTITKIYSDWEPNLRSLISKISDKFSSIFPTVGIAGEVRVAKSERFENWRLEILVKFREEAELKALDSHTQSGGERAVSTVYYMISLQELTTSPFRVVDEINQGMDARNERIVHKHMVETACQSNTSQYFLITPKLLTNLHYSQNMRVHCIMAGPWTPNPSSNPTLLSLGATSIYV